MHLTHLSLTNFRNFTRLTVDVPDGPTLILGDNAQGKTSLLEAVYYLATFTSFHADNDRQLLNFIAAREPLAVGRIVADIRHGNRTHQLEVRLIQESNGFNGNPRFRKEVLVDGVNRKVHEAIGQLNAVLFLPQMINVIAGAPEERRRYLNLAISQIVPEYAAALSTYHRSISQRNALLKLLSERGGDPNQLDFWDEHISLAGATLIWARIHAIQEIEHQAALIHHQLTRGKEVLRLIYQPSYDPVPQKSGQFSLPLDAPLDRSHFKQDEIAQGFHRSLRKRQAEEIARGVTTIGPHRDELRFQANGVDLGSYGSRGQSRTAMLALKIAEVNWMKAKTGQWPVLLLDEVLAELDPQRRQDLLAHLIGSEQTLLTTTDLDLFTPEFIAHTTQWRLHNGSLRHNTL